jgi:hypothetical protein
VTQAAQSLAAIPAFLPATVCTGYAAAWLTNLQSFRGRSIVERLFWSIPLSFAISTIAAVLIGKALSLTAVIIFFATSGLLFIALVIGEHRRLQQSGMKWVMGWRPLGTRAFALGLLWIVIAISSLTDLQSDHQLFMSLTIFDHASRVNWTESILRTGVPPANPLYFYNQPASMRYYYFWNVICAAVARMSHLPVRAVYVAGCVWGGFILAAITGLYLKYFLAVGDRLRRQFLFTLSLIAISGFSSVITIWRVFFRHGGLPGPPQIWPVAQLNSWYDSLLFVPHHISSMACCMFAFLLVWMERTHRNRRPIAPACFIAAALASSFGLSIYVTFGFFLLMILWALWQVAAEHIFRPVVLMAIGGAGALILLLPYLSELRHGTSGTHEGGGGLFTFAVRETIPPIGVLASGLMQGLAHAHPFLALSLSRLTLLPAGLAIELGVFLIALIVYLVPALRAHAPLSSAQRSLAFIAVAMLLISSLIRSNVLDINDFGVRSALFLQFVTLLMLSEILTASKLAASLPETPAPAAPASAPRWLRMAIRSAVVIGVITTIHQAIIFRFTIPIAVAVTHMRPVNDPVAANISHNAYISAIGYRQLNALIPPNAIVQPNPASTNAFWALIDDVNIDRQRAISSDQPWCGSELGGDPSGCKPMAAAIDALFSGANADQARATCRTYHIDYLIARMYDPAWQNKQSWVWNLPSIVSNPDFRALQCGPKTSANNSIIEVD